MNKTMRAKSQTCLEIDHKKKMIAGKRSSGKNTSRNLDQEASIPPGKEKVLPSGTSTKTLLVKLKMIFTRFLAMVEG